MKRLLNTLFITTQGAYLSRDGETILVRIEDQNKLRIPVHTLGSIVCFGNVMCTPPLMGLCAKRGVGMAFLTEYGKFLARIQGPASGNILLRREQYRMADDQLVRSRIARSIVLAKIANSRTVLKRAAREAEDSEQKNQLEKAAHSFSSILEKLKDLEDLEAIRGVEGEAASIYFGVFDHLIKTGKKDFFFKKRSRRPPLDNINALLSFLYTLLVHDVRSALECVGLDPQAGYLHLDRPGRPGLALDLMEELRSFLADRLSLTLVNRKQVQAKGFKKTETGAVFMNDATRKEVLVSYQKRKQEEITHPFLNEKIQIGLLPHVQAMLFARYLRGDLDGYPPFFWK